MFGNRERREKREEKRSPAPHDEFLELCAISTTGELSEAEQKRLSEHLTACSECQKALAEFEAAAAIGAPLVAAELGASDPHSSVLPRPEIQDATSPEQADRPTTSAEGQMSEKGFLLEHAAGYRRTQLNWHQLWMPVSAGLALIVALGIYAYQTGRQHGVEVAQVKPNLINSQSEVNALEQRLSDAGYVRQVLEARLAERDRGIRQLREQVQRQSAELAQVRKTETGLQRSLRPDQIANVQAAQRPSALTQQLQATELSLKKTQEELDSLQQARQQDDVRAASLSDQIRDLYGQLKDREQTINQQQEMLAKDRDIRDLMGARNLYIAEVYDVARDGTTRKPYGRVFYTKGKSLVFYAYDLDRQPGVKKTSTFQAWGQDGPDRDRALNLGIFYQDGAAQRRWVLKFDDPRKLDQINAVFVTVEPHGGSEEPSGKRLLFASLRIEPNHP